MVFRFIRQECDEPDADPAAAAPPVEETEPVSDFSYALRMHATPQYRGFLDPATVDALQRSADSGAALDAVSAPAAACNSRPASLLFPLLIVAAVIALS